MRYRRPRACRRPARRISLFFHGFIYAIAIALSGVIAAQAQPKVEDLAGSAVGVVAVIPGDAVTARALGTERAGNGIIIDSGGLVLTIGYLILEASIVELIEADGRVVPAEVVAYDFNSGFGLVRAVLPLNGRPVPLGTSATLLEGDPVLVLVHPASGVPARASVVSRRPFAGYWEYLLEEAIFTAPPHAGFGGAGLIDVSGALVGVGSLFVGDAVAGRRTPGNMFVPIDELKPILADMLVFGRSSAVPRPWLGVTTREVGSLLAVVRVTPDGPAERAGVRPGHTITGVDGERVTGMEDFYRKVWALGDAGVAVPLDIRRPGQAVEQIIIESDDRYRYLRLNPTY